MKLLVAIILFTANVVAANPKHCNICLGSDESNCITMQQNQTCATDLTSLGTTHCASAAIKYREYYRKDVSYGLFRGCIDCTDKKAACFKLGGYLRAEKSQRILLQCEIECCNDSNCNDQVPTIGPSTPGITVFTPNVTGPTQCQTCFADDASKCIIKPYTSSCDAGADSLGSTHCGSAAITYRDFLGNVKIGSVLRGCFDCADKNAACASIAGYLKARKTATLMECNIDCCTSDNCNDGAGDLLQCNSCLERDEPHCTSTQKNQTCARDSRSLGTTQCASAAIKYQSSSGQTVYYGFFRGCSDCVDKKAACFMLGGFLKVDKRQTLLQCKIECCNGSNCNVQAPTLGLSKQGITVFTPKVTGPVKCQQCQEDDAVRCTSNQDSETCGEKPYSLGTTHCGSANIKYRDFSGYVKEGVIRGCIDCADKKAACAAIGGYLKSRKWETLMECNIDCCTGEDCNDGAPDQLKCNACFEEDAAECFDDQKQQNCASDKSIGTTHCASMVGKFKDYRGNVHKRFFRGCIDCTDKKAACFSIGGFLKGDDDEDDNLTLLQCEIVCCNGSKCNNQVPTLTPNSINVFNPTATGPKQCRACLGRDEASCAKNQRNQLCATDIYSLGTTHCGIAVGKYKDRKGRFGDVFIRGCINCADKTAACAAVSGFLKRASKLTMVECNIKCCTSDNCDPRGSGSNEEGQHVLLTGILTFAVAFKNFMED